MRFRTALLATAALLGASQAHANANTTANASASPPPTDMGEVVVRALPLSQRGDEVAGNVAVLEGDELVRRRQATLGETLAGIPGVNSDTFGGGASRPVIRGQTSPRVRVLSDGSELMDASAVSPDHAVAGETLLLEGIEILRGPSALLYGGGAIGGAVNLLDARVPTAVPGNNVEGAIEIRGADADHERAQVIGVTAGAGSFAVRLEAANRTSRDYRIPSYVRPAHDDHGHDHDDDHHDDDDHDHDDASPLTSVEGSFNDSRSLTLGASWIGSRGWLGVAWTEQNSLYGLPGHAHEYEDCHPHGTHLHCGGHDDDDGDHDHDHDQEGHGPPRVDLKNRRFDLRGEIRAPFAGVERIRLRAGHTDYRHHEIENNVAATTFTNRGHDARVEVEHASIGGLRGVVGLQTSRSDFAALGAEAFIPQSITRAHALFVLEQYQLGDWRFEGALRHERQEAEALGRPDTAHDPFSASAAVSYSFAPGWSVNLSLARSQRAPNVQELYARGVHLATNTYEIGQADLDVETAATLELTLKKTSGATTFNIGVWRHDFRDYIYAETLDQHEDFRLIRYTQADAAFTGVDGEIRHRFSPNLSLTLFGDHVRAELDGGGSLPRIPAGRLGLRADGGWDSWSGSLEYHRVFRQNDVAAFETDTPGHDMLNATVARDFFVGGYRAQVFLRGTNLLDEVALNHASFIKDAAPLRGRNIVLGLRATF